MMLSQSNCIVLTEQGKIIIIIITVVIEWYTIIMKCSLSNEVGKTRKGKSGTCWTRTHEVSGFSCPNHGATRPHRHQVSQFSS